MKRNKCRLCRREGKKLFLKDTRCFSPKCPIERKGAVAPGPVRRARNKPSDFAIELREKQRAKRIYGIREIQFKNYYLKARRQGGSTGEALLRLLETRLDNVLFRLGFAPSRSISRQLISHGHVLVNGRRTNIASYQVAPGQVVTFSEKGLKIPLVKEQLGKKEVKEAPWFERKGPVGKMVRLPKPEETETDIDAQYIVEYYSR